MERSMGSILIRNLIRGLDSWEHLLGMKRRNRVESDNFNLLNMYLIVSIIF